MIDLVEQYCLIRDAMHINRISTFNSVKQNSLHTLAKNMAEIMFDYWNTLHESEKHIATDLIAQALQIDSTALVGKNLYNLVFDMNLQQLVALQHNLEKFKPVQRQ